MMKEVAVFATLLAATSLWVWEIRRGEEEVTDTAVLAFDPRGSDLVSVSLVEPGLETALVVEKRGEKLSTRITSRVQKKVAQTGPEPAPGEPEWGPAEVRTFPGNEDATSLVESLAPLKALRKFEGVDAAGRVEMGLDTPTASLTLQAGNGEQVFDLGEKAYSSQDLYAARRGGEEVYLLPGSVISSLQRAEARLQDRALLGVSEVDVASLQVGGEVNLTLIQQGRHDKANAWWKVEGGPEERQPGAETWVDKVFALKALSWPTEQELKAQGEIQGVLTIRPGGETGPLDEIQLGRGGVDPSRWYGRSQHTGVWVPLAADVAGEVVTTAADLARAEAE